MNKQQLSALLITAILFGSALSTIAQQTLFIDKQEYSCAPSFNLSVRTKHISNVVALQGTIQWDTAVIKYSSISFGSSAITLNASNVNLAAAANGYLSFLWFDNNIQGQSTVDSTALFTVNFVTNGAAKGKAFVNFVNTPTQLEIDTLATGGLPVNDLTAVFSNGYIVTPFNYNFVGSGNWSTASNWKDNLIPPAILPACSEIIINPLVNAECVVDIIQTIAPGAKLTVISNKKLRIPAALTIH